MGLHITPLVFMGGRLNAQLLIVGDRVLIIVNTSHESNTEKNSEVAL